MAAPPTPPHVSLAAFDAADLEVVGSALLEPLKECIGLRLTLASLGFFLTEESVAFLGVVPTASFLGLQRRVFDALSPVTSGYWPYYRPGALVPHCTLATGVTDHSAVTKIVTGASSDRSRCGVRSLVELPGAISRFRVTAP